MSLWLEKQWTVAQAEPVVLVHQQMPLLGGMKGRRFFGSYGPHLWSLHGNSSAKPSTLGKELFYWAFGLRSEIFYLLDIPDCMDSVQVVVREANDVEGLFFEANEQTRRKYDL